MDDISYLRISMIQNFFPIITIFQHYKQTKRKKKLSTTEYTTGTSKSRSVSELVGKNF